MLRHNQHTIQKQQQGLNLSVQQIQLLNFIQLNVLELEQRIRDEVEENPALDADQPEGLDVAIQDAGAALPDDAQGPDPEERGELINAYLPDDDFGDYLPTTDRNTPEMPSLDTNLTEPEDFREKLHQQLALLPLQPRERLLATYLADSLEDDGYLRRSMEDICDDISFAQQIFVTEPELEAQLETLQSLEPAGIGARDLRECLLLQLEAKHCNTPGIQAACAVVEHYLDDLAQRRTVYICQQLDIDAEALEQAVNLITKLSPRPVRGMDAPLYKNQNIIPEFVVEKTEHGELNVGLLHNNRSNLRLSREMNEIFEYFKKQKEHGAAVKPAEQYLKSKLDSALWFMEMIRQREGSMLHTIQAIVQFQSEYFMTGDKKRIRPMILRDIADRVGLDISTISRVTSTKYAQTDFGLVHLKSLFHQGFVTDTGELVTNQEIQDQLVELIRQEEKQNPLSDQEIADRLREKGYLLARRTVAKYRDLLQIPTAKQRQEI